ncbi:DUF2950 domain-containing protein [Ancylobacter defluvii]|uniref:DUF2950 domain-containing protein n=1 Tax=Ancylobacter defluvii TaxID=1282440 RepID=A0A9W6NB28_9HYPH|nr:DUF2950 domain-containing protein [Ancylobacter defluvii]MBS7585891.1 DUF2950 domain-containing protein [Ancylobacter defluvii]GLK84268.1 hypothetical protein GCM10017653_23380 [Ancylobacter defluvii]
MRHYRTSLLAGSLFGAVLALTQPLAAQQSFPTPEAAAAALVETARQSGHEQLDNIFGSGASDLLVSGDEKADRQRLDAFLDLATKGVSVVDGPDGEKVLAFGTVGWRFPIPLKQTGGAWSFDLAAGRQEVLDREIGRNEITAIGACADYVAAQKEYFASLHDDQPVQQYARRFISTPGRHDGLYWAPETPDDRSPLGDRIAAAALERVAETGKPRAYNGYIYRILTRQGREAPGGAYSYMVNGRLLAGFAMLAYPERWQETGIMTFLCDQRGQVYERNLGRQTASVAAKIDVFDPGKEWTRVGD